MPSSTVRPTHPHGWNVICHSCDGRSQFTCSLWNAVTKSASEKPPARRQHSGHHHVQGHARNAAHQSSGCNSGGGK
jgi:hypothetical protein